MHRRQARFAVELTAPYCCLRVMTFWVLFTACSMVKPEMQGMSLAGYEVVTPGNHEFDYGVDVYKNALSFAKFDVVSANSHCR